jgi:pyruvate,orthophosphate dikinase
MQARAIFAAAIVVADEGIAVEPEIMVPLVSTPAELERQRQIIDEVAERVFAVAGSKVSYKVGTMIEVPRAALMAGEIARHADFFSAGTNDLTQMTFGLSRDDAGKFLPQYVVNGLLENDPFQVLDQHGFGKLIEIAALEGRAANPNLHIGVCGEHGGEPSSIAYCHKIGLDYVSCSPFRVPVARLAAAQAGLDSR